MTAAINITLREESARTLARLGVDNDGKQLMLFLSDELVRLRAENDTESDDVVLRQRQGAIQYVAALLRAIDRAPDSLRRFAENRHSDGVAVTR